jgi:hypothetical protein
MGKPKGLGFGDEWIKKTWPLWNVKPKNSSDYPKPIYVT